MIPYCWWERKRGKVNLPEYIKDPRNFVLTPEELKEYMDVLMKLTSALEHEKRIVFTTYQAMTKGVHPSWARDEPRLTCMVHVLEFVLKGKRFELALMTMLNKLLGGRNAARAAAAELHRLAVWEGEGGLVASEVRCGHSASKQEAQNEG